MEWLNVTVETANQQAIAHPCGEIDIATAEDLKRALEASIQGAAISRLEVDMSRVSFMDCSGLRVLFVLKRRLQEAGGAFALTNVTPAVDRLLSTAGLDHWLEDAMFPIVDPVRRGRSPTHQVVRGWLGATSR
ncbi:STAS domain-containing protein [Planotetraspora sp. A-T 1434]|uniref:STAS domain-containing protein n=1 Tax=Planotetraspora sp. A-T 1434 TaxID=2979219 RepID=UPI0021C2116A|nr:STAS domain-containing protein [Planotetraspora sp. A-T 1434]MCT9931898.1 STAS domain-containing protein [Planotetraspora sp. A-T 1434]